MITKQAFDYNPSKSFIDTVKEKYKDFNPEDYEFVYFTDGFMLKELPNTKATKAKAIAEDITKRVKKNKEYFSLDVDWRLLNSSGFVQPLQSEFISMIEEESDRFDLLMAVTNTGAGAFTISIVAYDNISPSWNDKQICTIDIIELTNTIFTDNDVNVGFKTPFGEKIKQFSVMGAEADVNWLV